MLVLSFAETVLAVIQQENNVLQTRIQRFISCMNKKYNFWSTGTTKHQLSNSPLYKTTKMRHITNKYRWQIILQALWCCAVSEYEVRASRMEATLLLGRLHLEWHSGSQSDGVPSWQQLESFYISCFVPFLLQHSHSPNWSWFGEAVCYPGLHIIYTHGLVQVTAGMAIKLKNMQSRSTSSTHPLTFWTQDKVRIRVWPEACHGLCLCQLCPLGYW